MNRIFIFLTVLLCSVEVAPAFSLIGPFRNQANGATDPWQGVPYGGRLGGLGYNLPGDIGGPMSIQEGYRWNVPVLTYGFDPSFTDYFGQEGIAEVEKAIAILNALPSASALETGLNGFPLDTAGQNVTAEIQRLIDLKSHALALMLEQLGLASPERYVWSLRGRQTTTVQTNYLVLNLNYDPITISPSALVNGVAYEYRVIDAWGPQGQEWATASEWYRLDPNYQPYSSVAGALNTLDLTFGSKPDVATGGRELRPGVYFSGITRDDAGGLGFLLSKENKAVESMPGGVTGTGQSSEAFVNTALRPGVERISFQRQEYLSAEQRFHPITNLFQDVYFDNGIAITQSLKRIISTPDFIFRADDLGGTISQFNSESFFKPRLFERSDTSRWVNHADANGRSGGGGPGVIHPPIHITFNMLGRYGYPTGGNFVNQWGGFSESSSEPRLFLGPDSSIASRTVHSRVVITNGVPEFEWTFLKRYHRRYKVESSTNLIDWIFVAVIEPLTDTANAVTLREPVGTVPRFFRTVTENDP